MAKTEFVYAMVDGQSVKMSVKEWKAMIEEKQKTRRGKKRFLKPSKKQTEKKEKKVISEMAEEVESLIKQFAVLKSVQVYKDHAYRSWGTIANTILSFKDIKTPMVDYCVRFNELNSIIEEVKMMAKGNEKAVYQYIQKMSWKLEDMVEDLQNMMTAIRESGVLSHYKDHEAINGKGRQLGLGTVVTKCQKAMPKINETIEVLKNIAEEGVSVEHYAEHVSFKAKKRLGLT